MSLKWLTLFGTSLDAKSSPYLASQSGCTAKENGSAESIWTSTKLRRQTGHFFAECVTQYLRQSNIIELLLLSTLPLKRCWSFDQPSYLRRLGFFDFEEGVIEMQISQSLLRCTFPRTQLSWMLRGRSVVRSFMLARMNHR